jgi:hypothetical protein
MEHMPLEENVEKSVRMTSCKVVAQQWENPIPLYTQPADHGDELTIAYLDGVHTGKKMAKREWVGLTNEECIEIAARGYPRWLEFAQAVEAKLREKNGGAA